AADRAIEAWRQIESALSEAGRDPRTFGKEMVVGRAEKSPDAVAARLAWCREWGCTHAAIDTMGKGFTTAESHLEFLSEVRQRLDNH
ncbi:MAG: hypothetical protein ACREUT_20465, partial [Steroidobacteraceae bacterium]